PLPEIDAGAQIGEFEKVGHIHLRQGECGAARGNVPAAEAVLGGAPEELLRVPQVGQLSDTDIESHLEGLGRRRMQTCLGEAGQAEQKGHQSGRGGSWHGAYCSTGNIWKL